MGPDIENVVGIDSSAYMHMVVDSESQLDEDDCEIWHMAQALTYATVKRAQKKGSGKSNMKGKSICFDGINISSSWCMQPRPVSKQASDAKEIMSPTVQASSSKGKAPDTNKSNIMPSGSTSQPKEVMPPSSGYSQSNPSSTNTTASSSSNHFRYLFPLKDSGTKKHVLRNLLNSNFGIAICDLLAISPDMHKAICKQTTNKYVTIGTVSVSELLGQPEVDTWLSDYDNCVPHNDDSKVIAVHHEPLCCIHTTTFGKRVLTCILNTGTEVVVMPKRIWTTLGVGLHSDQKMIMESVNTSKDTMLGIMENVPLNFGAGVMNILPAALQSIISPC
ncbi:hypothetical protein EDB19DRAFT_1972012 [Suillus lakei]|nr:hypothetical protein EDB19DRAFT_1972012 [Suillus lakei]